MTILMTSEKGATTKGERIFVKCVTKKALRQDPQTPNNKTIDNPILKTVQLTKEVEQLTKEDVQMTLNK